MGVGHWQPNVLSTNFDLRQIGNALWWADIGYMEGYQEHLSLGRPNRESPRGLRMRCESKMSTELDVSDKCFEMECPGGTSLTQSRSSPCVVTSQVVSFSHSNVRSKITNRRVSRDVKRETPPKARRRRRCQTRASSSVPDGDLQGQDASTATRAHSCRRSHQETLMAFLAECR